MVRRLLGLALCGALALPAASAAAGRDCARSYRMGGSGSCGMKVDYSTAISDKAGIGQLEVHINMAAIVGRDEGFVRLVTLGLDGVETLDTFDGGFGVERLDDPLDGDLAFSDDGDWLFYARQTHQFSKDGIHVLDISDRENIVSTSYQPQGGALRVAYYKADDAEYVISLDATGGLVINRFVRDAGVLVPVFADALPATKVGGPASAGLFIDPKDPKLKVPLLYATNGTTGLDVYDISSPESPAKLGSWSDAGLADLEVIATKKKRTVIAAREYWFDKNAPPELIRLDATDLGAIEDRARLHLVGDGPQIDDSQRVQGIARVSDLLLVTHSSGGVVVVPTAFTARSRPLAYSFDLGTRAAAAEVAGEPYAMDVEYHLGNALVTDAATGRLTSFDLTQVMFGDPIRIDDPEPHGDF